MVQGRLIYIENNTQVSITPNASRLGYVILSVNLTSNTVSIYTKEQASSYPSLIQNDLSVGKDNMSLFYVHTVKQLLQLR